MEEENKPSAGQIIIEIQTIKEIAGRMDETGYKGYLSFTALKLKTKGRSHFFFKTVGRIYHAVFDNYESIDWSNFTNHVRGFDYVQIERLYLDLYDEVIGDLRIN